MLVKLQESSISLNLASLSKIVSWTQQGCLLPVHREYLGMLAISAVSPKDSREGTKKTSYWPTGNILVWHWCHNDVHSRKFEAWQSFEVLDQLIFFVRFCLESASELIPSRTQPIAMWSHWKNEYIVIWQLISLLHEGQTRIVHCRQVCTRFELQIFWFFLCGYATCAALVNCFWWASQTLKSFVI